MAKTARSFSWFAAIALAVAVTQASGYFFEVMDWDESTFLLMGREIAEGRLPYVALFDIKPPILYLWYWLPFVIFGDSIAGARFVGDVLVLLIAFLSYLVARRFTGDVAAGLGGLVVVLLMSPDYGQHTGSEIVAMAPVMLALWLLVTRPASAWAFAIAGIALGAAALTRGNLVVLCGAVALFLGMEQVRTPARWPHLALFAMGGLAPLVTVAAVYAIAGHLDLLRLVLLDVPLAYAGEQLPPGEVLASFLRDPAALASLFLAAPGFVLACLSGRRPRRAPALVALCLAAVVASIVVGGQAYQHYWIQAAPLTGILFALFLDAIRWQLAATLAASALLLGLLPYAYGGALGLPALAQGLRPHTGIRDAAAFLADRARPDDEIWAIERHLVLWYMGRHPPSPVLAHPANLVHDPIMRALADAGYVPADEFRRLIERRPRFLVTTDAAVPEYLANHAAEITRLLGGYAPVFARQRVMVWERHDPPGLPAAQSQSRMESHASTGTEGSRLRSSNSP